eukprot:CAMPEP_0197024266 /NCGR_PEP_ID=MMETSP1384-20130603/4854_1 /TAXON_ID=29189 /ORGANISM="Ammonia sp." /LENGTH=1024 /DNA_ID=CAMNT_0042452623 /DNA_START=89 /DNA_END=3163 /DNA_ORIENTATION=-
MIFPLILPVLCLLHDTATAYDALLQQIGTLYPPNAFIDDVNSIAIDTENANIYATNTASGTIDIISYSQCTSSDDCQLTITRSIDIQLQSSPYFALDYITSISYTPKGYMVATLIPLNYAKLTGWLVFIDVDTMYIDQFIPLKYCYSPKHIISTSDGNKLVIACEGLADGDNADPPGSISVVDITSNDATKWRVYNIGFTDYDDCDTDTEYASPTDTDTHHALKALPEGIYMPKPDKLFSINAEPEWITIDDDDRFVYITLQENNGLAILDMVSLEIVEIFSFGAHDFGFSGLDASDQDGMINIRRYANVYGLRQPDGITFFKSANGKKYVLTANEGNAKYYDTVRVSQIKLNTNSFPDALDLEQDENLGRLQILNGGAYYGDDYDDDTAEFNKVYTFGSRDFAIWEVEGGLNEDCPCDYPYALRQKFSSLDDFEQITAAQLGTTGFNSDFDAPSFDSRSDGKGPEPESITVGQCSNGDVYAFIGLERVGGIMVYDITDVDRDEVYFVEYLNSRDFTVTYDLSARPPESAGDVEPETMIFVQDTDSTEQALLFVAYKTSASIGVYSFDCGSHRNYNRDNKPTPIDPIETGTADECVDQSTCINVDVRAIAIGESLNEGVVLMDEEVDGTEMYVICMSFDVHNPYCTKDDDYFTYALQLSDADGSYTATGDDDNLLTRWYQGIQICQVEPCGAYARFAILDGDGCTNSEALTTVIDNVGDISCKAMQDIDACLWKIPTPACSASTVTDDDDDTASSTSTTSTSAPYASTTTTTATTEATDDDDADAEAVDASTCDTQGGCLKIQIESYTLSESDEYEICVYWSSDLDTCSKSDADTFAQAAVGVYSNELVNAWQSGTAHQLCKVVECGQSASFGIKDNQQCTDSVDFDGVIDSVDNVQCSGAYGGYGIDDSCEWQVPAPQCQVDYNIVDNDDGSNNGVETNPETENRNTFDTITNKGGHFYESVMFYLLIGIFALTAVCIVVCIIKHSKNVEIPDLQSELADDHGDGISFGPHTDDQPDHDEFPE